LLIRHANEVIGPLNGKEGATEDDIGQAEAEEGPVQLLHVEGLLLPKLLVQLLLLQLPLSSHLTLASVAAAPRIFCFGKREEILDGNGEKEVGDVEAEEGDEEGHSVDYSAARHLLCGAVHGVAHAVTTDIAELAEINA